MARLDYECGDDTGSLELGGDAVLIGRVSECAIRVSSTTVTRKHARIRHAGERYWLDDLGSDNGTLVNGSRIRTHMLAAGDEIVCGQLRLRFVA